MTVEVSVDDGLCLGAQRCLYLAPAVFELNDVGQADVLPGGQLSDEELIEVARQCPNFAIRVVQDGKVIVGEE